MHADECSGHRRVAGQEERLAFFDEPGEAVADWVGAQVGPVVAHTDHNHWLAGTCKHSLCLKTTHSIILRLERSRQIISMKGVMSPR